MYYIYLPKNMKPDKDVFEKVGFTFQDTDDDVLYKATLPDGWELKRETTSLSLIIDEKGQKRGYSEFYTKYIISLGYLERAGHMSLNPRFSIEVADLDKTKFLCVKDVSTNRFIYIAGECASLNVDSFEKLYNKCTEFLNEHYPDWEDVTKYWD